MPLSYFPWNLSFPLHIFALFSENREFSFSFSLREVKMLEGKAMIEDTDMPIKMQMQAMSCASQALDLYDVLDCKSIAAHIKKEFDYKYGGGWQCVVGSNFGCFFTHSKGSFIYFTLETLNFLIFKGASEIKETKAMF
ncbi:Dynein light chain type 1 family protein [Euphorbia peplus]|nr:Dynein light chain type 1 family protein [Euphorbia peplus]